MKTCKFCGSPIHFRSVYYGMGFSHTPMKANGDWFCDINCINGESDRLKDRRELDRNERSVRDRDDTVGDQDV